MQSISSNKYSEIIRNLIEAQQALLRAKNWADDTDLLKLKTLIGHASLSCTDSLDALKELHVEEDVFEYSDEDIEEGIEE